MKARNPSNAEIALRFAKAFRAWRVAPEGACMSQNELARRSGMSLTALKRFERTGGITLRNLAGLFRVLGLLDRLEDAIPEGKGSYSRVLLTAQRARREREQADIKTPPIKGAVRRPAKRV